MNYFPTSADTASSVFRQQGHSGRTQASKDPKDSVGNGERPATGDDDGNGVSPAAEKGWLLSQKLAELQECLQRILQPSHQHSGGEPTSNLGASNTQELLDKASREMDELQCELNFSCAELSKRELAAVQQGLRQLATDLEGARRQLLPRPKFSFRRKHIEETSVADSGSSVKGVCNARKHTGVGAVELPTASSLPSDAVVSSVAGDCGGPDKTGVLSGTTADDVLYIRNLTNTRVVKGPQEIHSRTCVLSDLDRCEVLLLDFTGAVYAHRVTNSFLCFSAVSSSALLYSLKNCDVVVAAKQLRIHDSENSTVYSHTLSSPIIENCDEMQFGRYCVTYDGRVGHWKASGLFVTTPSDARRSREGGKCEGECGGISNTTLEGQRSASSPPELPTEEGNSSVMSNQLWAQVVDFNWQKKQASPHWRALSVAEQMPTVRLALSSLAGLVEGCSQGNFITDDDRRPSSASSIASWQLSSQLPISWKRLADGTR